MKRLENKNIHVRCPRCREDITINGNELIRHIQEAKHNLNVINVKLRECEERNEKGTPKYKRLKTNRAKEILKLNHAYDVAKNTIEVCELEKYRIFRGYVEREIGKERTRKLLGYAEEDMTFTVYELYKQRSTNFDGV